jgi:hypothetical protein
MQELGTEAFCLQLSWQDTGLACTRRINRIRAFIDVADSAFFIDYERNAVGKKVSETENSVSLGHLLLGVTQQRKSRACRLGEFAIHFLTVEADPQHLGARGFELGDFILKRLDLLRSARRRSTNVESQHHSFLAAKIPELDGLAVLVGQGKVRGAISDLQRRRCCK